MNRRRRLAALTVATLVAGIVTSWLGALPAAALQWGGVVTGAGPGGGPHVRLFNLDGGATPVSFMAYNSSFTGGVHVARADLNGDATGSHEITSQTATLCRNTTSTDTNGVFQDDTGFEFDEIVTGAGAGGGPHVRAFRVTSTTGDGSDARRRNTNVSFMAYNPSFTGGVRVAGGDLDWDGCDEIVTGAGQGGGPHVKVWDIAVDPDTGSIGGAATVQSQWMAFSPSYTGGIWVGVTKDDFDRDADESQDCDGSTKDTGEPGDNGGTGPEAFGDKCDPNEGLVIVGTGAGGASELRGFDRSGDLIFAMHGNFGAQNAGGESHPTGRQNGHWLTRFAVGTGPNSKPLVTINGGRSEKTDVISAYDPAFTGGVHVGMLQAAGAGRLVTAPGPGGGPHVKVWSNLQGVLPFHDGIAVESQWMAYNIAFRGGVFVAAGEFLPDCDEGPPSCN